MPSIFSKEPKQPPYKQALLETETSILKRLNSFIDETTNKWKSTNDWIKKTGDQVNELLKRTFDLQRKVEGDMIDMESKFKREISKVPAQLDKFYDDVDSKFPRREELLNISDDIAGTIKKLKAEKDAVDAKVDQVRNQIPKNVVKEKVFEEVISEVRTNLEKIANAIPKNVASNELVSDIRREIIEMFDPYVTSDALKSVEKKANTGIGKVAKAAAATSQESKRTLKEFNKLASKVKEIKEDYVSTKMIPQIRSEITKANLQLTDLVNEVENKIPTDYAKTSEVDVLREFQKDIRNQFEAHKQEQNKSISTTMANIESIMSRSTGKVEKEIQDFKSELAETTMGEDTNFMKNIIRDIADEEIKSLRNQNMLFQENVKNTTIEMKNQNRAMASKMTELQASFDKLIKLAQNK